MAITNAMSTPHRSAVRTITVLLASVAMIFGFISVISGSVARAATPTTAIATLGTNPSYAAQESTGGVKVAMMELNWSKYEPQQGVFNVTYERQMQGRYASLKAAGMRVTLGLGLHFTPAWVKSQPNATFVDQDGGVSTEANMVFNNNVRQLAENYLARANSALPFADFWAVRVTSGGKSEVLYPQSGKYWAFDVNAQNGPAMPATMDRNPFPGWRPGTAGLTTTQVTQWADWYVGALADTARWQANVVRGFGFRGYVEVVTPGIGVLDRKLPSLAATNLPNGTLGAGAAWGILYSKMVGIPNVVAHVSSVADGSKDNTGCTAGDRSVALDSTLTNNFSAAAWVSRVADEYGFGKSGENPGMPAATDPKLAFYLDTSPQGMLATSVAQAQSCGFQTFYWAHDDRFWTGAMPLSSLLAYTSPSATMPALAPAS